MIVYFTHIHKNSCKILIVQLSFAFFCTDNEIFTMLHPMVSMLHPIVSMLHPIVSMLHPIVSMLHPIVSMLHPIVSMLHPIVSMLHPIVSMLHPTVSMLHPIVSMLHPIVSMLGIVFIPIFEGNNFRRLSKSRIFMVLFSRIICHRSLCYIIMHFDCFKNSRI